MKYFEVRIEMITPVLNDSANKKIGIVLLNWNGWKDTAACIDSLKQLECHNYTIIVVDNDSTDNSVKELSKIDNIVLLQSKSNLGFSGGCNIGIEFALQNNCQYVWLLNNDTIVDSMALCYLLEQFSLNSKAGIVGSAIFYFGKNEIQCYGGGKIHPLTGISHFVKCSKKIDSLEYISGASMLVTKEVFEKIGLLSNEFFLYWEDTEFCFRAKRAGFELVVAKNSTVRHKEQASANKVPSIKCKYYSKGGIVFLTQYFGKTKALIFSIWIILKQVLKLNYKNMFYYYHGIVEGLDYVKHKSKKQYSLRF